MLNLWQTILFVAVLSASGCDNSRSKIIGKWKVAGGTNDVLWEFSENGNVSIDGTSGRYTFGDGKRIKIQTPTATFVHQLEFKDDRMIWKDPSGTTTELTKVK